MNRTYDLKKTMPYLIDAAKASPPVEVVVVDYNSQDNLAEYIASVKKQEPDFLLTYRKYTGRDTYHMAHARNLSILSASGEYIVVFSTDLYPVKEFIPIVRQLIADTGADWLYTGSRFVGVIVLKKSEFIAAGGYDERFELYGPEDKELNARLHRRGLKSAEYPAFLGIINTPDEERTKNYRLKIDKHVMSGLMRQYYHQNIADEVMEANQNIEWGRWSDEGTEKNVIDTLQYINNKYNIHTGRQQVVDIPNMGRADMATLFAELDFKKGAEIGVEKGLYSEVLCKANPSLHLSCIDPWEASAYEPDVHGVASDQESYDNQNKETVDRLALYNCTIVRKNSMAALEDFEDGSLDFVYIDANHDLVNFISDLHHWEKKVKVGGIVSGHDYAYFPFRKFNHVKRGLLTYVKCYNIAPLFIVGAEARHEGLTRDSTRSWFWVKD